MVETVFVACRLPNGLVCDVYDPPGAAGGPVGPRRGSFTLRGSADARRLDSNFATNDGAQHVVANHGITEVDKDLWTLWAVQSKDAPYLKSGAIFMMPKLADTQAAAKERAKEKTGLEPMDPDKPAPGIEKVETPRAA
jgi:hypothetical protein